MTALTGPAEILARLAATDVRTAEDVLQRSECIRDLPDRSNHLLRAGDLVIHVKRRKGAREPREAAALERVAAVGVPTPVLAFAVVDPMHGALTGTLDLAPAEPLDDLLRRGLDAGQRAAALSALADLVAALHDAGLHHRDLYLCHVFARFDEACATLTLIDLERVGRHRKVLGRRVVKDLAALRSSVPAGTTTAEERAAFLSRYLERRGLDLGDARRERLERRIRRKSERIRAHVPRTPVGDAARPEGRSA